MRTEKEIKQKIQEIKDNFFEINDPSVVSLSKMKTQINALLWVLGKKQWYNYDAQKRNAARLNFKT